MLGTKLSSSGISEGTLNNPTTLNTMTDPCTQVELCHILKWRNLFNNSTYRKFEKSNSLVIRMLHLVYMNEEFEGTVCRQVNHDRGLFFFSVVD